MESNFSFRFEIENQDCSMPTNDALWKNAHAENRTEITFTEILHNNVTSQKRVWGLQYHLIREDYAHWHK